MRDALLAVWRLVCSVVPGTAALDEEALGPSPGRPAYRIQCSVCLAQLMDFEVQLVTGESTPKKARGERRYGCGSSVGCFTSFCFRHKEHTQMGFCDQ